MLPTLFTTGNLALGCFAVGALFDRAEQGALAAAVLIIAAALVDAFDGMVARLTGTDSRFGMEFDSLADVISFGMAPAWLAYVYCLKSTGPVGLVACVWYVTCTAWRLARFNVQSAGAASGFRGLPSPIAGGTVASFVILVETVTRFPGMMPPLPPAAWPALGAAPWVSAMMAVLGWLMISNTPYLALKGLRLSRPKPLIVPLTVVVFGFVVWSVPQLLFALCLLYIFLGLILRFLTQVRWAEVVAPQLVAWAESRIRPPGRPSASPAKPGR